MPVMETGLTSRSVYDPFCIDNEVLGMKSFSRLYTSTLRDDIALYYKPGRTWVLTYVLSYDTGKWQVFIYQGGGGREVMNT